MPRRKVYRKRKVVRRKRLINRRKGGGRAMVRTLVNRGPSFLPDQYKTKLKFTQRVFLNAIGGIITQKVFRGNSAFDPDFALGGNTPVGYDQLATLYNRYRVDASSISITAFPQDVTDVQSAHRIVLLPIVTPPTLVVSTQMAQLAGMTYAKETTQGYGAEKAMRIRGYMTTAKMVNKKIVSDVDYQAEIGLSPAKQWYWVIYASEWQEAVSYALVLEVKMSFWVSFYERKAILGTIG